MKLGRLLMTGVFMTASSQVSAGFGGDFFDVDVYTKHEAKLKLKGFEQGGDKITLDTDEIGALLCGREMTDNEELVVYVPCVGDGLDIDEIDPALDWDLDAVALAVADKDTGIPTLTCDGEIFGVDNPIVTPDNDGRVKTIQAAIFGDINIGPEGEGIPFQLALVGTTKVTYAEIKDNEGLGIGKNCAKKAKFNSLSGFDDFGGDYIFTKCKECKLKDRQSVIGTEIWNIFD